MPCFNSAIFKHKERIKHQKYLAQMGTNTKTISKLGKVCSTFMKVSFFLLTSVKTNICLCSQLQVRPGDKMDFFHSVFFLFVTSFSEQILLLLKHMHILTILASRPQPQTWIQNFAQGST